MRVITREEIFDLSLPWVMAQSDTRGSIKLMVDDGEIETKVRIAIINLLFWRPLIELSIVPCKDDFWNISRFTSGAIKEESTHIYNRILIKKPDVDKLARLELMWKMINNLYQFVCHNLNEYHQTIDAMGLVEIRERKEIRKLVDFKADLTYGIAAASIEMAEKSDELLKLMSDESKPHQLLPFLRSGNIKLAQFPQIFLAYGSRADVDSSIKSHYINESNMSGLKSNIDFATEQLAAKKAMHASRTSIQDSQSMGRKLRILCSPLRYIHKGSCGNNITIPFDVTSNNRRGLVEHAVVHNGERIYLTKQMADELVGKKVGLVSPITCRHTDGFCEHCAGWGYDHLLDYFPNVIAGTHVITWLVELVSQSILSTKHRAATSAREIGMSDILSQYFTVSSGDIYLDKRHYNRSNMFMRISREDMRPLTDLEEDYSEVVSTFSEITSIGFVDEDHILVNESEIGSDSIQIYLSSDTLDIIAETKNEDIKSDEEYIYIPLHLLPTAEEGPVFSTIVISADMEAFAKRLKNMIENKKDGMFGCHTVSGALQLLTEHVYSQSDLIIFPMQILIRSLLLDPSGAPNIPIVNDVNNVIFGTFEQAVARRSVAMRLVSDRFKSWLQDPTTYTTDRGDSVYDVLFGLKQ